MTIIEIHVHFCTYLTGACVLCNSDLANESVDNSTCSQWSKVLKSFFFFFSDDQVSCIGYHKDMTLVAFGSINGCVHVFSLC